MTKTRKPQNAQSEIDELRARLAEAEQTLAAIRSGEVDAVVVEGPNGPQAFTLQGPDQPYRVLIEQMNEGTASISDQGLILYCNQRLADMLGHSPESLTGSPVEALVLGPQRERFQQLLARGLKGEVREEIQLQRKDGTAISVHASLRRIQAEQLRSVCLVATDLSEIKQKEKIIRMQASQYAALVSTTSDGYWRYDRQGTLLDVNATYCRMSGYSRDELLKMHVAEIDVGETPEDVLRHIQHVVETGFDRFETKHRKKDGDLFDVEISATYLPASEELLLFARDITEHKRTDEALRARERELNEAQRIGRLAAWELIPADKLPIWSEGVYRIFGLDPSLPAPGYEEQSRIFTAESWQRLMGAIDRAAETAAPYELDLQFRFSDGSSRWLTARGEAVRDADGTVSKLRGTIQDITERKLAEEVLEYERWRFQSVLDNVPAMMCLLTPEHDVVFANQEFRNQFGEANGRKCYEYCFNLQQPCEFCQSYQVLKTNAPHKWEVQTLKGRRVEAFDFPFKDRDGRPLILEMNLDVTEQRQAEEEIRKLNESLEARVEARTEDLRAVNKELETFNYAIAHDLRGPLRHIHGFAEILAEEAGSKMDESSRRHLDHIRTGVRHMSELLEDLLELSRLGKQELRKRTCGLRSLVDEVINNLESETKDREVDWKIAELPFVECDPGLMKQVLTNLLTNALKFTRPRTPAIIEIGSKTVNSDVVFYVRDNGVGFSPKYADKLFGLFQRLHRQEEFEGTGVGLAMVQRIINKHGGQVWAEGELNKGATVYFKLQAGTAQPAPQAMPQPVA